MRTIKVVIKTHEGSGSNRTGWFTVLINIILYVRHTDIAKGFGNWQVSFFPSDLNKNKFRKANTSLMNTLGSSAFSCHVVYCFYCSYTNSLVMELVWQFRWTKAVVSVASRYRFMVIDRLGTDLQKKFEEYGKRFPRKLVLQLGLRVVGYFMVTWFPLDCLTTG